MNATVGAGRPVGRVWQWSRAGSSATGRSCVRLRRMPEAHRGLTGLWATCGAGWAGDVSGRPSTQTPELSPRARPLPAGPAFELLESKLQAPVSRRATVLRSRLVDQLECSRDHSVVDVFAGPGYGKT